MTDGVALDWILDLYEDHRPALHRLAVLLGAGDDAGPIVRSAVLALHRRSHRLIDPVERVEFLQEQVVHLTRALGRRVDIPVPDDGRHVAQLDAVRSLPGHLAEIIVVSHFLSTFGPPLSRVMRLSVRGSNQRLEIALETLRNKLQSEEPIDALSEELIGAFKSAARQIKVPADEPIEDELRARQRRPSRGRVRGQFVVVASLVALALGAAGAAFSRNAPEAPTITPTASSPSTTGEAAPVALRAVVKDAPVHFVGRTDGKLYRELRSLPSTGSLARTSVEALFTVVPDDPDYMSLWEGQVNEVEERGKKLIVDLSADAYEAIAPDSQQAAIDQMAHTVVEALEDRDLRVTFLADGRAAPAPFGNPDGHGFRNLDPMPALWITSPRNQSTLEAGTLTVTGTSKPEYGAPVVIIRDTEKDKEISTTVAQTTLTRNAEGWLVWSVSVPMMDTGTYDVTAQATTRDPASGAETIVSENKVVKIAG